jgi:hypothetical protein
MLLVYAYIAGLVSCCVRGANYKDDGRLREAARMFLLAPVNFIAWPLWIWRMSRMLGTAFESQWCLAFGRAEETTPKDAAQIAAEEEVERLLEPPYIESSDTKVASEDSIRALRNLLNRTSEDGQGE